MVPNLCGILDRLPQFIGIVPGIVTVLLPQVQQLQNLAVVFRTISERRGAPQEIHQYRLELAADRRIARSILSMIKAIVEEVKEMEALSLDRGIALCCWVRPRSSRCERRA